MVDEVRTGARRVLGVVAAVAALAALAGAAGGSAVAAPRSTAATVPLPPGGPGLLAVPDPLPAGSPGDVIASAPFVAGPFPFTVEAHQVLFLSTDRDGARVPVSGYVLVPTGVAAPAGGRAVVAWAHGTAGLIDGCAPSLDAQYGGRLNSPDSYDRIDQILAAGDIVVASDYPGLGTPGVHPYLDGDGEARTVLDSIRAARSFGATRTAVVEGFSQGSQAAIFSGEIWEQYAPEIDLRAVVAIGTPSLYGSAFAALGLPVVQAYVGKMLAGIVAGHPELDRSQILTASGEQRYEAFVALDRPDGECEDPGFDMAKDMKVNPMTIPAWRAAIEANYPGKRIVPVPVLMVQSAADEQALAFLADGVCRDLQAEGTDLRMWRYTTEGHLDTVEVSSDNRATWILDRLAGEPLTDGVAFTGEAPRVLTTCPSDAGTSTTTTSSPTTTSVPPRSSDPARPVVAPADFTG